VRATVLEGRGLPAQAVFLGARADLTDHGGAGRCAVILLAGAQVLEAPGCTRFRTFWQHAGN
jgi:hypothetical protein